MSNEKVRTRLAGYGSQVFPPRIDELNGAYGAYEHETSYYQLTVIGHSLSGEEIVSKDSLKPTTGDGYGWFCGLNFNVDDGRVALLFPWAQDIDKKDGTLSDRSCAAYIDGNATEKDADAIIERFCAALK